MKFNRRSLIASPISLYKLHKMIGGTTGEIIDGNKTYPAIQLTDKTFAMADKIPEKLKVFAWAENKNIIQVTSGADTIQLQNQLKEYDYGKKRDSEPKGFKQSLAKGRTLS